MLGGIVPAGVLWQAPGVDACPTALHAVLALVGNMDQDVAGGSLDGIDYSNAGGWFGLGCLDPFGGTTTINRCWDDETSTWVNDWDVNGDGIIAEGECSIDPSIEDGYSMAMNVSSHEAHVVQQESLTTYCP